MSTAPITASLCILAAIVLAGCAERPSDYDYAAFHAARPRSLLLMPPLNSTPDVKATPSVWAQAVRPLAEAGYYVMPITLVEGMFRQNGVPSAHDAAQIPYTKLHEIFGADAAVYINVSQYGSTYAVIDSETRVEVSARIIDLRSGSLLWEGAAAASSGSGLAGGGLSGILISAIVHQVVNSLQDASFDVAERADRYLFETHRRNGLLPGPRFPVPATP